MICLLTFQRHANETDKTTSDISSLCSRRSGSCSPPVSTPRQEGADVWLDKEKLLPGQDWVYEIRNAIHNSDLVIACLSRQFNKQGGFRHEELKIAVERANSFREGQTFIIPARLELCELPDSLRRWQCVDLFETDGYKSLLSALTNTWQ